MLRFQILVDNEPRKVQIVIGNARDLALVNRWHVPVSVAKTQGVRDTVEFAHLAAKRWRYYRRSIATALSLASFKSIVFHEPQAEVSLLLLVHADWFQPSQFLGLAQCRRTYCHHLVLEFLSVHPAIVGDMRPRIRGVGSGLVYSLAELAGHLEMKLVWGEATAYSAPFYSKTLGKKTVQDHFFIRGSVLKHCRRKFREEFQGELDSGRVHAKLYLK